jgi:hypothetical protein
VGAVACHDTKTHPTTHPTDRMAETGNGQTRWSEGRLRPDSNLRSRLRRPVYPVSRSLLSTLESHPVPHPGSVHSLDTPARRSSFQEPIHDRRSSWLGGREGGQPVAHKVGLWDRQALEQPERALPVIAAGLVSPRASDTRASMGAPCPARSVRRGRSRAWSRRVRSRPARQARIWPPDGALSGVCLRACPTGRPVR